MVYGANFILNLCMAGYITWGSFFLLRDKLLNLVIAPASSIGPVGD